MAKSRNQKPKGAKPTPEDIARAKTGRLVAFVLVGAAVFWIAAQWIGAQIGLPGEYAILFDLLALAAFAWSLIVAFRLWRQR